MSVQRNSCVDGQLICVSVCVCYIVCVRVLCPGSGEERGGCQGSEGREGQRDPKRCGNDDRPSGQSAEEQTHHPHG